MQQSLFLGSAFRNKIPKENTKQNIEETLFSSGLLGKNPENLPIIRSKSEIDSISTNENENYELKSPKKRSKTRQNINKAISKPKIKEITPRRPQTALQTKKIVENSTNPPNIYFATVLPSTEPPAPANFLQLSEMLDRLLKINPNNPNDSYFHIFGDVVRQYYIECSTQGELLEKCRQFYQSASQKIPEIMKTYQKQLESLIEQINKEKNQSEKFFEQIKNNEDHSFHLNKVITEMKSDLSLIIGKHDNIVKNIATNSIEAADMKKNVEQIDQKIIYQNKKLMQLNEQLRSLDLLGAQYSTDTIRFAENLKSIKIQKETGKLKITNFLNEIRSLKGKISILDREIGAITKSLEESQIKPQLVNVDVQIDLINRKLFKVEPKQEQINQNTRKEYSGNLYERIKQEYLLSTTRLSNESLTATTYDDFYKLKNIILSHEEEFRISKNEIINAQNGNIKLEGENFDFLRLFASKLANDAIDNAISKSPTTTKMTQTLSKQAKFEIETQKVPIIKEKTRFVSMLNSDYSIRNPKRFDWFLTTIRSLYDEKASDNEKRIIEKLPIKPFPEFILEYAKKKLILDFVSDQFSWDVHITSHEHFHRSLEAEMFTSFLDETYNKDQLSFFLKIRADCIKIGCSVTIKTRDQLETFNEYYLSQDQLEKLLPIWWEERYQRSLYLEILEYSIARPAIHLEATKRYVAMHDILNVCINTYEKDTILRLNELLLSYRIVPRLNLEDFNNLMIQLIPILTKKQIEDFYRSTVTKSKQRSDISKKQFIKLFKDSCFIYKIQNNIEIKNNFEITEIHEAVSQAWFQQKSKIMMMIDYFQAQSSLQPDNLTLKSYLEDAQRYLSMLNHSLTTGDGDLSCNHFYRLLFTLDILFSAVQNPDPILFQNSLISMECAIRETWLDSIFSKE